MTSDGGVPIEPRAVRRPLPRPPGRRLQTPGRDRHRTGLRWGELTELRGRDLKTRSRLLTVSHVVVELNPKFHPEGKRFLVKDYPKDKEWHRFKLSDQIVAKLEDHIIEEKLGTDGLLFIYQPEAANEEPFAPLDPETLGWSEENTKGRRYRHAR